MRYYVLFRTVFLTTKGLFGTLLCTWLSLGNILSLETMCHKQLPGSYSDECQTQPYPGMGTICCPNGRMHIFNYDFSWVQNWVSIVKFSNSYLLSTENLWESDVKRETFFLYLSISVKIFSTFCCKFSDECIEK